MKGGNGDDDMWGGAGDDHMIAQGANGALR